MKTVGRGMHESMLLERRWVKASVLVGFWTLVALIYIALGAIIHLTGAVEPPTGDGQAFEFGRAFWTLIAWYTWIPSTLIVLWLARRFPLDEGRLFPNVLVHVVAAPLVSLFASLLYAGMRSVERLLAGEAVGEWFPEALLTILANSVRLDSFIYLTILAGVHAFEYYRKYRERELQASQLETELAEARLHALRLQLQPHFLFNTFNTIAMLVRKQRDEEAIETIAVLSDFLRYVLDNTGAQEVSLKQELDFLESYLAIERIRFKDRLDIRVDVEDEAFYAQVPNLILQPLVENAVRHGIEPAHCAGQVEVVARREGDRLRLRVCDDGVGLPENWRLGTHAGVGLANTKARLGRLYGDNHHLEFTEAEGGGLMVTIVIPYRIMPLAAPPSDSRRPSTAGENEQVQPQSPISRPL